MRGATKLGIPLSVPTPSTSIIFETLQQRQASRPLLPLVPGLVEPAMELFLTPSSVKSTPSRLQKEYRPPDSDPAFLRAGPTPHSVIVVAAKKQHATAPSSTVPPDKGSRKLVSVGRKVCNTAATSMKAASTTALLGRYDRSLWESLHQFIDLLPRDKWEDFQEILNEGLMVSNQIISAAADTSLLSAHEYCHGVTLLAFLATSHLLKTGGSTAHCKPPILRHDPLWLSWR